MLRKALLGWVVDLICKKKLIGGYRIQGYWAPEPENWHFYISIYTSFYLETLIHILPESSFLLRIVLRDDFTS